MKRVFVAIVFCALVPMGTSAQVIITEIMYDLAEGSDSGREWIEVFNTGSASVVLSDWKVFENGTNHKITGGETLVPGAHAVVADNAEKFKADWPAYSGLLFDSAFSLSNEGESVSLRDTKGMDSDSATFSSNLGGKGTGDSLQRSTSGTVFEAGIPTPGAGIPAGGLTQSPAKASKTQTKDVAAGVVATQMEIVGESAPRTPAASAAHNPSERRLNPLWWLTPFLLASMGSLGIIWSRHLKKSEWEILEENG